MGKRSDQESQIDRFRRAAKEIGCDPSEEAFEEKLRTVATSTPTRDDKERRGKSDRKKKG